MKQLCCTGYTGELQEKKILRPILVYFWQLQHFNILINIYFWETNNSRTDHLINICFVKAFVGSKKVQDPIWQFDLKSIISLKINAILQSLAIYVSYNLAKSSDLSNKIFSNKVWCILDVSVNYLSSIQATFRGLHSILQDENKVLNWKQIHKR